MWGCGGRGRAWLAGKLARLHGVCGFAFLNSSLGSLPSLKLQETGPDLFPGLPVRVLLLNVWWLGGSLAACGCGAGLPVSGDACSAKAGLCLGRGQGFWLQASAADSM